MHGHGRSRETTIIDRRSRAIGKPWSRPQPRNLILALFFFLCYNTSVAYGTEVFFTMRCSCKECGTYMIQAESDHLGCVCPDCGCRCNDCLGTDTVVSRDRLKDLAFDPRFAPENLAASFVRNEDEEWYDS